MRYRLTVLVGFLAIAIALPAPGQTRSTPESKRTGAKAIPRAPDGHPDLQGVWTNATITPMERPAALAGKATLTDAEAKVLEKKDLPARLWTATSTAALTAPPAAPGVGAYNNLFVDRGSELARVDGVKRTSLIVDPPDGKVPPDHGRGARTQRRRWCAASIAYDSVKDRPLARALPHRIRLHLRSAHAAGALQQQLPDRADARTRS